MMKTIYLIAFRGIGGLEDGGLEDTPPLIRTGHVGMAFEKSRRPIFAFRPTEEAVAKIGGYALALVHLKNGNTLPGCLYEDYNQFRYAYRYANSMSSDSDPKTTVYRYAHSVADDEYVRIRSLANQWLGSPPESFIYSFPGSGGENCAKFLARFGLPVFGGTGKMKPFMEAMIPHSELWIPEE